MATTETIKEVDTKIAMRPPNTYNVILYNDDVTSVEFVIMILMQIFHKSSEEATAITMNIHNTGKGVAGTYSLEVATQKRDETVSISRQNGYSLKCEVESNS